MKSRVFRALIQSMLLAAPPLSLQAGCGPCTRSEVTPIPSEINLTLQVAPWGCEPYCGTETKVCSVKVAGSSPLSLDCDGKPPAMSLPQQVYLELATEGCSQLCGTQVASCGVGNQDTRYPGQVLRYCSTQYSCPQTPGAIAGRRPADLQLASLCAEHEAGAFFAETCQLEAAAVTAFSILAAELRAHGAPAALIAAAERAEDDEARHTQLTAALARRFAAEPAAPCVQRHPPRPLLAVALENVVEGCVREAYAAFVTSYQGEHAQDPQVRAIMARIARDEIEHAELAFAVDEWIRPQLSDSEYAQVQQARAQAYAELAAQQEQPRSLPLQALTGWPPSAVSQAFLHAHAQQLS
jgi:hypothetical protein